MEPLSSLESRDEAADAHFMGQPHRTIAVVAVMCLLAVPACASEEDRVAESHQNGAIVFGGFPDESAPLELYKVDLDGSGFGQLTDDRTFKTSIAPSPDGSRVAYAALSQEPTLLHPQPELGSIYVVDVDGSDRRAFCEKCSATVYTVLLEPANNDTLAFPTFELRDAIAWSPDGSRIAAPAANHGVLLIDPDSGETQTLPTPEPVTSIAWSPDGNRLALSHTWFRTEYGSVMTPAEGIQFHEGSQEPRPGGIYLMDAASGQFEEIVSVPRVAHVHGWSADGKLLVFSRVAGSGGLDAYSISEDRTLTLWPVEQGAAPLAAAGSPTDDRVAFLLSRNEEDGQLTNSLWLLSPTSADPRELSLCQFEGAFDGKNCVMPKIVWSPDGTTIAYRAWIAGTPLKSAIVLQEADSDQFQVVRINGTTFYDGRVADCCLAWLPAAS
jgi:Tol biopolymer transport system component